MTYLPSPEALRPLGKSGIMVSPLAWGNWRLCGDDVPAVVKLLHAALDAGINLVDTADIYGPDNNEAFGASESLLGRALASEPGLRDKLVIATKGGISMGVPYDSSAGYLTSAIDASLTRLGTDTVELWQIHRPDILTHPSEIAKAIDEAHKAGKIRSFGVSNFTAAQIATLQQFMTLPIVSTQPELSALKLAPIENGELDQAIAMDMAVMAWSPPPRTSARWPSRRNWTRWQRNSACRARRLPIAGSWRTRPAPSPSSDHKRPSGSRKAPTHSRSAGPGRVGTRCWSPQKESPCHECNL